VEEQMGDALALIEPVQGVEDILVNGENRGKV